MQIAIVGDIHTYWNDFDVQYFNSSSYDLIIFCGDLPGRLHKHLLKIANNLSTVQKPAVLIPGNHDGTSVKQLLGEILKNPAFIGNSGTKQFKRMMAFEKALGRVLTVGYSLHTFGSYDLIALRPHSMGGAGIAFQPYLQERFGVSSVTGSFEKIKRLIDQSQNDIIFLGHNGPKGLGEYRNDIFGCDFRKEMGDFGDEDSQLAVEYAIEKGKRVRAFIAGHMHHQLRGGGERIWTIERDGISYINAARVPRIFRENGLPVHHHVRFSINKESTVVEPVFIRH